MSLTTSSSQGLKVLLKRRFKMLKRLFNRMEIDLGLSVEGPLLIREGRLGPRKDGDQTREWKDYLNVDDSKRAMFPNSFFVCYDAKTTLENIPNTNNPNPQLKFYVPGSSLRGVFRSHLEKILRSYNKGNSYFVCNPFDGEDSCSKRLENKQGAALYEKMCIVCKIFGNTSFRSRISLSDAPIPEPKPVLRDGIAIDRFTGGVKEGHNYKLQVLENIHFTTTLTIQNFEKWQIGLLAFLLRDLEAGEFWLGAGKSKGFGKVSGKVQNLKIQYYASKQSDNKFKGIEDLDTREDNFYIKNEDSDIELTNENGWKLNPHTYLKEYEMSSDPKVSIVQNEFWKTCAGYWSASWNRTLKAKPGASNVFKTLSELKQLVNQTNEQV